VTISKDGKFATLTFNQALLSQAAPPGPPAVGQMPPGVAMIPQPGAGKASRAHSRTVIQRNPKAVAAAASTPNPVPTPTSDLEPSKLPPQYEHLSPQQLTEKLEQEATAAANLLLQQQQNDEQTRQLMKLKEDSVRQ
jgi:hypothetical protein